MTTSRTTGRVDSTPYAVPVADLDAVRVGQAQMVELASVLHRPLDGPTAAGDASADGDGD